MIKVIVAASLCFFAVMVGCRGGEEPTLVPPTPAALLATGYEPASPEALAAFENGVRHLAQTQLEQALEQFHSAIHSTPALPPLTTTAASPTKSLRSFSGLSKTSTPLFGSIRNTPRQSTTGATAMPGSAGTIAPLRTTQKRSDLTPATPTHSTTGPSRTPSQAGTKRHSGM